MMVWKEKWSARMGHSSMFMMKEVVRIAFWVHSLVLLLWCAMLCVTNFARGVAAVNLQHAFSNYQTGHFYKLVIRMIILVNSTSQTAGELICMYILTCALKSIHAGLDSACNIASLLRMNWCVVQTTTSTQWLLTLSHRWVQLASVFDLYAKYLSP